jgi:hypothetical protein
MISTTGRPPRSEAPTPAPTIASSEMGVSQMRSGPKRSKSPFVTPKTPPDSPMSSPIRKTFSSRSRRR